MPLRRMLAASYASVEYVPGTVPLISSYCVANSEMAGSSAASEAKKHGQLRIAPSAASPAASTKPESSAPSPR